jgi:ATP-binding cassette subfamily B multidrug efflux pump
VDEKRITGGEIEFRGVEMRYSKSLRPALMDLSFQIERGMKVSVVGRTGSGKSSMF